MKDFIIPNKSQLLKAIESLPVISPVLERISKVVSNTDSSCDDIVNALKLDPAISTKVLKLANSAYVGIPRAVSSLKNAVVLLGQKRIYSLVLSSSVLSSFSKHSLLPFNIYNYWKHSTVTAMIAESVARHLKRYGAIEPEEIFTCGLLHDIGRLILGYFYPEVCKSFWENAKEKKIPLNEAEDPSFSHTSVGFLLAEHWKFPVTLKEAIFFHHKPQDSTADKRIVSIIHISDALAHIVGCNTFDFENIPNIVESVAQDIILPPERLKIIAEETLNNQNKLESFINFLS
jgi:putative nucleotidyltransferase with HDIG domain